MNVQQVGVRTAPRERFEPAVRELRDSLMLLGLAAVSLGGYVGLAIAAVRLFATR